MKYNTTYKPKIFLKDTIVKTNEVIEGIINFYKDKYKITCILSPSFYEENSEEVLYIEERTRPISFDFGGEYKVAQFLLTQSNWFREMISNLNLDLNEGLFNQSQSVWRDAKEDPVSSVIRNELTFQIKLDKNINMDEVLKRETKDLYDFLINFENKFMKDVEIKSSLPQTPQWISPQMMENEYPTIDFPSRENEMVDELLGFIFKNPGIKLFSGHYHTYIPPEIYSLNHFNQIIFKDYVNSSVLKVASISFIALDQTLSDQLTLNKKSHYKEMNFYSKQIKKDYNILEVKVNIGRLMMGLLKKGHISEVQPGVVSNEAKIIRNRYKLPKY